MKVGIVSESPADDEVFRILLAALTNRQIELLPAARPRAGGWPSMLGALQVEYKHLHYNTDAHAIVAIADSDDSTVHDATHDQANPGNCRFCMLSQAIRLTRAQIQPRHSGTELKFAIGLAVPALEAWLLCGIGPHYVEAPFVRALQSGASLASHRQQMKIKLYGTPSPPQSLEIKIAAREATRLAADLALLERHFPAGFLPFAQQVRAW